MKRGDMPVETVIWIALIAALFLMLLTIIVRRIV
jgi:hypothetical protein